MASEKILEVKKQQVQDLATKLSNAGSVILADYRGLTVEEDTQLRAKMRAEGIEYKVIKNNIIKHAIQGTDMEALGEFLVGPTSMAFGKDEVAPAKAMFDFAKKLGKFDLKAGIVDGKILDINGIEQLAKLPSKEEMIAKMLGSMNSPITGLVTVLGGTIKGLAVALNAIIEKKQSESA